MRGLLHEENTCNGIEKVQKDNSLTRELDIPDAITIKIKRYPSPPQDFLELFHHGIVV